MAGPYATMGLVCIWTFLVEVKFVGAPPVSMAAACAVVLLVQYAGVYLFVLVLQTRQLFGHAGVDKLLPAFSTAKELVMFCPMLALLFVAARLRAVQLGRR